MFRMIAVNVFTMAIATTVSLADTITMRTSATVAPHATAITLGDIAELHGEHAELHAGLVLAELSPDKRHVVITVQQVREALESANVHWGLVDLNGLKSNVRAASSLAGTPKAMAGASIGDPDSPDPQADERAAITATALLRQRTAASVIAITIARQLHVDPAHLRCTFDDADQAMLDLPTAQYRIEIEPLSSFDADRVNLQVRAWQNGVVTHRQSVSVRVEVLVDVAIAVRDIRRGAVLQPGDARSDRQWIGGGSLQQVIAAEQLTGRIATTTLHADDVIRLRDVKRQTIIERGDTINVRCVVGGVVLTMQAEARADASVGDAIEFRKLGERDTFIARVTEHGDAVVDLARR